MPDTPLPHPAKGVLAQRRITNRRVAETLGYSEHYVSRVLNGYMPPSPRFRRDVAGMLDVAESDLFRDEQVEAAATALIERTRVARGLPRVVEDPAIVGQVAAAVRSSGPGR